MELPGTGGSSLTLKAAQSQGRCMGDPWCERGGKSPAGRRSRKSRASAVHFPEEGVLGRSDFHIDVACDPSAPIQSNQSGCDCGAFEGQAGRKAGTTVALSSLHWPPLAMSRVYDPPIYYISSSP